MLISIKAGYRGVEARAEGSDDNPILIAPGEERTLEPSATPFLLRACELAETIGPSPFPVVLGEPTRVTVEAGDAACAILSQKRYGPAIVTVSELQLDAGHEANLDLFGGYTLVLMS